MTRSLPLRWPEWAWLALVLLASSLLVVHTSRTVGPTFDEPFYLTKGLDYWRTGSAKALMRAGTMPLPVDAQTLPLFLWERHRDRPIDTIEELDAVLPIARAMALPFWWLLLASGFRLARRWGGPTAGAVAVGLLGFEPNLIAHAALATTDVAVSAAVLAATDALVRGLNGGFVRRILVPGAWAGIAVLCKASAVTFVPIIFAVVLWWHGAARRIVRDGVRIGGLAAVLVFGYVGSDWAVEPSFVKWANTLPEGTLGDGVRAVANRLRIFPNAAEGVIQQVKHNIRGHGAYSLGEYRPRAVWYYFPVLLSQKLTLPVLTLLAVAVMRRNQVSLPACIAVALLLFSLTCRVQIGIRLVFPLVTFVILAASVAVGAKRPHPPAPSPSRRGGVQTARVSGRIVSDAGMSSAEQPSRDPLEHPLSGTERGPGGEVSTLLAYLAIAASALIAFASAPHGLRYQNELWGGSATAADHLTDSNFDWGQGLPELKVWWRDNGEPPLTVWYYGTDPNAFRPPFRCLPLQVLPDRSAEFVRKTTAGGYFAVGRTFLTACPDRRPDILELVEWLKAQPPVADVGCFRIYSLK